MRWDSRPFLYPNFWDNGRGAADPAEAASINGLPINQKLQTINASSRYGNGIKYIVVHYTGLREVPQTMRPIFQLDTVGRPPTILSGTPERSGRVCLTVWRPGR